MKQRGVAALGLLLLMGCASGGEPDIATLASNSDQVIWEAGQKAFEKKQWENARQHYRRIVDGFPQSEYGPAARLALADSYFQEGGTASYILAFSAYREFLTLYPSHPRSDYATFHAGECYFKQKNGPDRDQTNTRKALDEYERLLEQYPGSQFVEQGRARVIECRQSLARAEFLAGYFYQRTRQAFRASIQRYETLLKEFPDFKQLDEVLYRLAECLHQTGRSKEALPVIDRLLKDYPESEHAPAARKLISQAPAATPTPSPLPSATPPSPATLPTPPPG